MIKYEVIYSNQFKKSLKKMLKHGKDLSKLDLVIEKLAIKEQLEIKNRDHTLYDDKKYKGCRDCHIEPDWLLIYKYLDNELILLLVNTGSHSDVF